MFRFILIFFLSFSLSLAGSVDLCSFYFALILSATCSMAFYLSKSNVWYLLAAKITFSIVEFSFGSIFKPFKYYQKVGSEWGELMSRDYDQIAAAVYNGSSFRLLGRSVGCSYARSFIRSFNSYIPNRNEAERWKHGSKIHWNLCLTFSSLYICATFSVYFQEVI